MAHLTLVTQVSTFLSLEGLEGVGSYIPEQRNGMSKQIGTPLQQWSAPVHTTVCLICLHTVLYAA
jgi:hypothetical protein